MSKNLHKVMDGVHVEIHPDGDNQGYLVEDGEVNTHIKIVWVDDRKR